MSAIAKASRNAVICGLARANYKDIDRCWEAVRHAKRPRIHTFIGTSPLHRAIPNLDMDQMAERIHDTVSHARNLCDNVQWSPMDATRTEHDNLCRVVEIAIKAGAYHQHPRHRGLHRPARKRRPDPDAGRAGAGGRQHRLRHPLPQRPGHGHGECAGAVEAGARQIECTINGLGERAGNTALEEVVMALKVRNDIMPFRTANDTTKIMNISRKVATVSGFPVQFNKAIVGKNAFAHESGIHQDGMLKNAETFEIMRPTDIGPERDEPGHGQAFGARGAPAKLHDLGYELADNQLNDVFVRFKALADRKKEVYDDDLIALMTDQETNTSHDTLQVKRLRVVCGTEGPRGRS